MRSSVACWLSVGLLLAAPGRAADAGGEAGPLSLARLMEHLATQRGVEAHFRERKEIALLAEPLESSGRLYFVPPDRMVRFTLEPAFSSLVVDGPSLRFREQPGGPGLDLSGNPVARVFVENFIVLFNGDLQRLEELYETELSGGDAGWKLRLKPRRSPLSQFVEDITLRGDAGGMREMVVRDVGGDRTTMTFDAVQGQRRFSPEELETLFGEGAPLAEAR